jgi:hypothetical protein
LPRSPPAGTRAASLRRASNRDGRVGGPELRYAGNHSCRAGGCAGAHERLVALAAALPAPVVYAFPGKEFTVVRTPIGVAETGLILPAGCASAR